jgi:enamidase
VEGGRCFGIGLAAYTLVLSALPAAVPGQAEVILLGAKIITGEKTQTTAEAVALAGERVLAVGTNAEIRSLAGPNTRLVDLHGRTIIPGLIDAHVHLLSMRSVVDEPSLRNYERTALPEVMAGFISHGITTVQSTGDPLPYIAALRDRLERGELVGPRLRITGPSFTAPGGHPATTVCQNNPFCRRLNTRELDGEAQARQAVQEVARAKVDAIKVIIDDTVVGTRPLSDAIVATVVAEAHSDGLPVIAHVAVADDVATTKRLIETGLDQFAHPPVDGSATSGSVEVSEVAATLARRTIPVMTTVSRADVFRDATGAERTFNGNPYTAARRQQLERKVNAVRSFSEAGVKLLVGTDWARSPVDDPRLRPGAMTLYEIEVLHRAGLSTLAVLIAATRNAAEGLGIIDSVGTIAQGKFADLVVLDGDLMQDFSALYRMIVVLKGGRIVHGALPEP